MNNVFFDVPTKRRKQTKAMSTAGVRLGWFGVLWLACGVLTCAMAAGISLNTGNTTASDTPAKPVMTDTYGRSTPRGTVQGFLAAIAADDKGLAANFLDDSFRQSTKTPNDELVDNFKSVLDIGGRLHGDLQLSDSPDGNLTDNLPSEREKVGTIKINNETIDVELVRKTDRKGNQYWQFAKETLDTLNDLPKTQHSQSLAQRLGVSQFSGRALGNTDVGDMLALMILLAASLFICFIIVRTLFECGKWLYPKVRGKAFGITPKVIMPLTLVIVSLLLSEIMLRFGVPVTLRTPMDKIKEVVAWLATAWLMLRLIDALFNRAEARSLRKNRPEQVSMLSLLRKVAKAVMLIVAVIVVFGNLGFDLTTGIAALGVGGLALAFGAQKTIENLIGSVVVVADRPVHVGDYCRFGAMEGTVIDIGIRSSRIRTLERTVLTVPNGEFSAMQIENYATRDMFRFFQHLYLKRSANVEELGRLVRGIQTFISEHDYVNSEWTQVRISELRQDCYVVEMRCYIDADNVREFYTKQSELILDILTQVAMYDVEHALPSSEIR
ncbi:MAG: mechanosensitive ion channel family protein, partial [Moraxella sp.]|nr:mechanosensitive ion channel family protein [Moraxella sp.]